MKFLVNWRVHEDKRHETLKGFSQMSAADDAADMGKGVRLIGRWHDLVGFTGAAVVESDDPQAVAAWLLNWNAVLDAELVMVLDDEETRAVGRKMTG